MSDNERVPFVPLPKGRIAGPGGAGPSSLVQIQEFASGNSAVLSARGLGLMPVRAAVLPSRPAVAGGSLLPAFSVGPSLRLFAGCPDR